MTLRKEGRHGEAFAYKTVNTEVLSWVMKRATGVPLAQMLSERLWAPLGCEQDGYLSVDPAGVPMGGAGLNATLRDLAFGAAQRVFDAGVGEHRRAGERGGDGVVAVHVAPQQAQRFAQAERAQQAAQHGRIMHVVEDAGARVGVARVGHQAQRIRTKQQRIAQETAAGEIAGEQHAAQAVIDAGIVVERHYCGAAGRFHARKAFGDEGGERRRPARGIGHAAIVAGALAGRPPDAKVKAVPN